MEVVIKKFLEQLRGRNNYKIIFGGIIADLIAGIPARMPLLRKLQKKKS